MAAENGKSVAYREMRLKCTNALHIQKQVRKGNAAYPLNTTFSRAERPLKKQTTGIQYIADERLREKQGVMDGRKLE